MKGLAAVAVFSLMLAGAPVFAQTPQAPAPAAPATPPPAAPAAQAPAPRPFPEGSKVAFVVLQRIANESISGKAATAKIQALQQQRTADLNKRNQEIQALQQRLEKEATVLSPSAAADIQKQIERGQVDLQRATQDAQQEIQELTAQLQEDFRVKMEPVLAQVAEEKGLHFVFNGPDAGLVWADTGHDLSEDGIKRVDAQQKQ
ncbi:MAG: OmpH family outer membrane protein, partial [Vicinamibacterales bacterium]